MITIDEEFKNLIQPLTDDEFKGLEESIIKEGCRDKLVLWGDTLIDGHNRYSICQKHGITFETVQKDFQERNQAIAWIIRNQFSRRNITPFQRSELALKLKDVISQKAKEKQYSGVNQYTKSLPQNSAEAKNSIETREELAKAAKVSHDTIAKVEKIKESAPLPVVQAARQNEISINSAYQVTKLEPEEQQEIAERIQNIESEPKETNTPKAIVQEVLKRPHVSFNSGNNEWYTPAEFIEAAVKVMGKIDLDPASNEIANKVVQATTFYTSETNGLAHEWSGNIWLNPPYSSDLIGKFADKVISEYGNYSQMIYQNKAMIFLEYKFSNAALPYGQKLALQRIADNNQNAGKDSVVFVCEHNVFDCEQDIIADKAIVREFYYNHKWYPDNKHTVKEKLDKFIDFVNEK